jgi:hexokinase
MSLQQHAELMGLFYSLVRAARQTSPYTSDHNALLCLHHVQAGNNGHDKCGLPVVGFCFSFAMEQAALDSGKLLMWSKGFTVDGVQGNDVVQLLSGA